LSDLDCAVVFLSSVAVDESLLEVQFDAYVRKPTTPADLQAVVERWCSIVEDGPDRREYESLQSRLSLFESALGAERVRGEPAYRRLRERSAELEPELGESATVEQRPDGANERPV
jgi:hypothetical protein